MDLENYPGGDLVEAGFQDLKAGKLTEAALLVLVASPRLRSLGFQIEEPSGLSPIYEHQLYELIECRDLDRAHRQYNALISRMASFTHAYAQFGPKTV